MNWPERGATVLEMIDELDSFWRVDPLGWVPGVVFSFDE
jgi:hypothetical protein